MTEDCDKVILIEVKPEISLFDVSQDSPLKDVGNDKTFPESVQDGERRKLAAGRIAQDDEGAEERQRTGRYLAIGVTLVMLFIAFYHTLLRHATVLAGLLAPAVIMLLYILWLFYFAKKKKTQVSAV